MTGPLQKVVQNPPKTIGCYHFHRYQLPTPGVFEDVCAATFILTMTQSDRREGYWAELSFRHPTQTMFIVENPGFRHGHKPIAVTNSMCDIAHAQQAIARFAEQHFPNQAVLVFEDDFIWDHTVTRQTLKKISHFLVTHSAQIDCYFLGCFPVPLTRIPFYPKHHRLLVGFGTHAVIHWTASRQRILQEPITTFRTTHFDTWLSKAVRSYTYHRPLLTQVLNAKTENSKHWVVPGVTRPPLRLFRLDNYANVQSGTRHLYVTTAVVDSLVVLSTILGALVAIVLVVRRIHQAHHIKANISSHNLIL